MLNNQRLIMCNYVIFFLSNVFSFSSADHQIWMFCHAGWERVEDTCSQCFVMTCPAVQTRPITYKNFKMLKFQWVKSYICISSVGSRIKRVHFVYLWTLWVINAINHYLWWEIGLIQIQTSPKDLIEQTNCLLEEWINDMFITVHGGFALLQWNDTGLRGLGEPFSLKLHSRRGWGRINSVKFTWKGE